MPASTPAEPSPAWAELLSQQSRDLVLLLLSYSALTPLLASRWIIDVRLAGVGQAEPLLPDTITIEIAGNPQEAHRIFDRLDGEQHCILFRNILQRLPDYRRFLAAAFERLAIGGFLVATVPHQFLYERKLQLPSRHDRGHLRFYTPAALLTEIEEALDPCRYRLRLLADHDADFDYGAPLAAVPAGGHDVVLCLEKIARPPWRGEMEKEESQSAICTHAHRFPPPYASNAPPAYRVIAPDPQEVQRLLVLKLDHRGDFMMALPAFRVLRNAFPSAALTLVCGNWNRVEAEALEVFDRVVPFDFFAEDASAVPRALPLSELYRAFAERFAGEAYDVAIDLRLYSETRPLLQDLEARHKAGFDSYDEFPWLTIPLTVPVPTIDGQAEQGLLLAADFHTLVGEHQAFAIEFREETLLPDRPHLVYGPYTRLRPGHYEFEVLVEPRAGAFDLSYDVAVENRVLAAGLIRVGGDRHPRIGLHTHQPIERFEFRIAPRGADPIPPFRFLGLRYRRTGDYVGVHQREAMALLAHLVALRLENPYRVAEG